MRMKSTDQPLQSYVARGVLLALAVATLVYATGTHAQNEDRVKTGVNIWRTSGCADCHGPFADGEQDDDDFPRGANLRTTRLDGASLKLTISCGRPGTGMPSFDEGAYTGRACYGRPLGAPPDNLQPTPRILNPDEIDAVIAYLQARIIGHGKITLEECLYYYDNKSDSCEEYK
jgi:mono/diheme cytochrome c family protein